MFSFSHLLIGLGFIAAGILFVKYTFQIMNMTGRQDWIEKYTGGGTTYGIFKLFGVVLVFVGILFATGFGNNLLNFLFAPLRHIFAPGS
jgi:hypothetical protein